MILLYIVRELSKLFMFLALWGFPILLAKTFGSSSYLWFFALSFIASMCMFAHYETIERIDNFVQTENVENNE